MLVERAIALPLGAATAAAAASMPHPTIWVCLGYPFEAASLIAAIFAAITTRVIIGLRSHSVAYALDAAVLALVLATTAAIVISWHTNLVGGLLYGTGFATIGEGLIRIAQRYADKGLAVLGIDVPDDDHDAAMSDAMSKLKKLPDAQPTYTPGA